MQPPSTIPTAYIGSVPLYGDLILSPMVGYSDMPFRLICREMGSAMSYVPYVLDDAVNRRCRRAKKLVDFHPAERPVALQVLGKEEGNLLEACRRLLELAPDWLDLNLGCPARRVSGRGRGAALLCEPLKIGRIVSELTRVLPVPLTAKIRLGWDDNSRNYLEVAHILEESGIAAIAVHGRTKAQGYSGRADWQAIAEVRAAVRVPVLANGDVRTVADIAAIKAATGCELVLIGRGAVGNPWIFSRRDAADVPYAERLAMIRRHLQAMTDYYGERIGLLLFRKHVVKYIQELDGATDFRPLLCSAETPAELLRLLEAWPGLPRRAPCPQQAENTALSSDSP